MNDARLAASSNRARKARGSAPRHATPAYPRLAGSGLEPLESRLMMSAVRMDAEFAVSNLGLGDDRSTTTAQSLGFDTAINFYGTEYTGLFVNNNGNISFGARNSTFIDAGLDSIAAQMIAPFYADVDTRSAGSTVRYGRGTVDGHAAFAVNWVNVDYYSGSASHTARNSFQLVLIDRSDLGAGNFDIEFNYDQIQWESGLNQSGDDSGLGGSSARVGFTAGDGWSMYEMFGSGVAGSFLDGNLETGLALHSFMSDEAGRYVYRFRDGTWADAPSGENNVPVVAVPGALFLEEGADGSTQLPSGLMGFFQDADSDIWTVTIDYGDGSSPEVMVPGADKAFSLSHTYNASTSYLVTVTVNDGHGGIGTGYMAVDVQDVSAPVLEVSAPGELNEGGSVTLVASTANDPDANDFHSFEWLGNGVASEDGRSFTFHATDSGTYTVRAIVRDQSGNESHVDVPVVVGNVAPTLSGISATSPVDEGSVLTVSLDGGADASAADMAAGLTYSFDFDGDGVYEVSGASASATHVFDDNGMYSVRARVADKDGGHSDYSVPVHVKNVAPRSPRFWDNNPKPEGSVVTVGFDPVSDPSGADTAAGFTYSFDFDNDGVFEVSGSSPTATHTFGDNGVFWVRGRVTDKDGGFEEYTTDVEIHNVAPTARLVVSGTAVEGGSMGFALEGAADPSAADMAAGLTYSFDLDNDGVYETTGGLASARHSFANEGSHTVRAKVTDKDGGSTEYSSVVEVVNAAPVITSLNSSASTFGSAEQGSVVAVSGAFADPGMLDTHTAVIDWGDGTTSAATVSAGTFMGSHVYASGGIYSVTVRVTDNAATPATATGAARAIVTGAGLRNGVLEVVGTNGSDRVTVDEKKGLITVKGVTNQEVSFPAASVREVQVWLGAGADRFDVRGTLSRPVYYNGTLYSTPRGDGGTMQATTSGRLFSDVLVAA